MAHDIDVLIAGAGPTGLAAALALTRHGVRVRVVEQNAAPSRHSKALVIQARTMEVFHALGVAEDVLAKTQPMRGVQPVLEGKQLPFVTFDGLEGPYTRPLMLRQSQTEQLLAARLETLGVCVEWGVGLRDFEADEGGVRVTLSNGESLGAAYLIGCDGAHSLVRKQLGVDFEGSTYDNDFIQVDAKMRWPLAEDTGYAFIREEGALVCLPLGEGIFRTIYIRQERPEDAPEEPELREFQAVFDELMPGEVEFGEVEWIIRFRLHERLASRFRVGRVFLAGDAAHIHTPAGGQGMNTGIQDAFNLGWKLGLAVRGAAGERLLESYHDERHPIAADVLRFTDLTFKTALGSNALVRKLRPLILPFVLGNRYMRGNAARTVSQLDVNVRRSPIVDDRRFFATGLHAGDRAPDASFAHDGASSRVFDLLRDDPRHLVFAHYAQGHRLAALERGLDPSIARVIVANEGEELEARYHLGDGPAIWVVRPDGYIGYRQSGDEPEPVLEWFQRTLG
ncbi:FAD-dependent monooxygenase [Pseudenhygromyxa sp. WMMC2535]|uniref:FAD-dependent monooxygenase n=1 Tax=Pseudenhygromyxa sp. WMMC2535 TaxID=2712867 RepID=UPI001555470C|nr:FAD-dependent monooxygenase [Pseudenhygromyxa sp. WMMC2535]NVB40713.1 FAD-dependent monooxygenase [Pseudenhygromyxa sp. WMMC2535]